MADHRPAPEGAAPLVRLTGLRRSFRISGGKPFVAVDIPRLVVAQGTILTLLGPNGSGKSTLLHLIAGLLRPDTGEVVVAGRALSKLTEAQLDRHRARTIGYLLQGGHLLEGFTAEENVMAAMLFAGRPARQQRQRARELLARFGVQARARHRPAAMSGGERQRVALARALANDPPLILADEVATNLDPPSARRFVDQLQALCREEQRTLIVATHRPELFGPEAEVLRMGEAERGRA